MIGERCLRLLLKKEFKCENLFPCILKSHEISDSFKKIADIICYIFELFICQLWKHWQRHDFL